MKDDWRHRRRMTFGTVFLSFAGLAVLGVCGSQDGVLHRTIADGLVTLILVVVPSYIGAPVVDDWLKRRTPPAQ